MTPPQRLFHALATGPPIEAGYSVRVVNQMLAQRNAGVECAAALSPHHSISTFGRWGRPPQTCSTHRGLAFHRFDPCEYAFGVRMASRFLGAPLVTGLRPYWRAMEGVQKAYADRLAETLESAPDAVIVHSPALWTDFGFRLAERFGCPAIYDIHGAIEESNAAQRGDGFRRTRRYRLMREAETQAAQRAAHCFVLCQTLREEFIGRGIAPEKITVIPNGVNPADFVDEPARDEDLAQSLGLSGAKVVGYVTSMTPYEAIETIIDAVGLLRERGVEAKALLVGDGATRKPLEAYAERAGVRSYIVFTGRVESSTVSRYMALMDIFAVSRKKTRVCEWVTPLKPFEAMAAGRPIFVSDLPALREAIDGGRFGTIFAPEDSEALAAACEAIFNEPDRARATASEARQWVLRDRSWDVLAQRQIEAIASLGTVPATGAANGS